MPKVEGGKRKAISVTMATQVLKLLDEELERTGMNRSAFISMSVINQLNANKVLQDLPATIEAIKKTERQKVINQNIEEDVSAYMVENQRELEELM